jgi:putative spermidine/putrescine transport system ATP-binding protein
VHIRQCAKTFADGTRALAPVDLEIAGGETVVLLGPSGCGKTTLLRIIAGLETADAGGQVLFNAQDVTALPVEKRNVGMVFQSYALFPNMSVRENIAYGLRVRKHTRSQRAQRVAEMLSMMHINELADRAVSQLSGGQRQRVALARAIAVRPRVLLLDEPLTALDALLRERLRIEIDSLLRSLGITAIYVTHDQAEAMALADRIVVMSQGRIAQQGTPRDVYQNPQNPFVADFIGTVNRLRGTLTEHGVHAQGTLLPLGKGLTVSATKEVDLLFRPEDMRIVPAEEAQFIGTVSSAFYLGDRTRLLLAGIGDAPVMVEVSAREPIARGTEVGVSIDPQGLMMMPGTPS